MEISKGRREIRCGIYLGIVQFDACASWLKSKRVMFPLMHPPVRLPIPLPPSPLPLPPQRLYELVVRHFLACVSQPACGKETVVTIRIAAEAFTARGLMITAVRGGWGRGGVVGPRGFEAAQS